MKSFLFNPITGISEAATYQEIQGFTGMSISAISKAKKNRTKIKSLNGLFIIDDSFTNKDLYELRLLFKDDLEVWSTIENFPNYLISNLGRVKSIYKNKERLLKPYSKSGTKALMVKISNKKVVREAFIYKLVAEAFLPKVEGKNAIYHKDGNLRNDDCNNLKWVSKSELGKLTGRLANQIPVLKLDKNTLEVLDDYESISQASRYNFLHKETVRLAVIGKLKTAGGFVWKIDTDFVKKTNNFKGN